MNQLLKELWKRFDYLSTDCYVKMATDSTDLSVWNQAFDALMEVISEGRKKDIGFCRELYQLDDVTDYEYDVEGWLEDYLDVLDINGCLEQAQKVCGIIIDLFDWEECSPTEFRFQLASSMGAQGKNDDVLEFCEDWYKKEEDNNYAVAALIYAKLGMKDLEGAKSLVEKHISMEEECTVENDCLFSAAQLVYRLDGNREAEARIQKKMDQLERKLEEAYARAVEEGDISFGMEYDEQEVPEGTLLS